MRVAPGTPIEPRAGRQDGAAHAVDARRQDQGKAGAGGAVDGLLHCSVWSSALEVRTPK